MNSYGRFFMEFLTPFFDGLILMFTSFFSGLKEMFNIVKYLDTITKYQEPWLGHRLAHTRQRHPWKASHRHGRLLTQ